MTAKLIRYIEFSLYNCLELTIYRVWKTGKTQEISFRQISKHPAWGRNHGMRQCCFKNKAEAK